MLLLWCLMAGMAAFAGYWIARPLLRVETSHEVSRDAVNLAVYQDKLAELDTDLANGKIDSEMHQQLRAEVDRLLLADTDQPATSLQPPSRSRLWFSLLVFLSVPLLTFGYYYRQDNGEAVAQWLHLQNEVTAVMNQIDSGGEAADAAGAQLSMLDYLHVLQRKAQQDANNPVLWYQVGIGYLQVNAQELAKPALRRAYRLAPDNLDYQVAFAQVLIALNEGKLSDEADELLLAALAQQPRHIEALMLRAMAAFAAQRYSLAIDIWQGMLNMGDGQGEGADILRRSIQLAQSRLAGDAQAAPDTPVQGSHIRVKVQPDQDVLAALSGQEYLLVYARSTDGNPMPVAVARQRVTTWPVDVVLSDAQAMTEQRLLSGFDAVDVLVRISDSGEARGRSGDWQAQLSGVVPSEQGVIIAVREFQQLP